MGTDREDGFISSFKKLLSKRSSITVPDGYQPVSTLTSLKHLLAAFVGDLEPQKDCQASTPRHVGRIVVTLATIAAFAAMAALLFATAVPSSRTVRKWAHHSDQANQDIFNFTDGDAEAFKNDSNQICFCRKTNINWPDYVAFFGLTMISGNGNTNSTLTRGDNITFSQAFCDSTLLGQDTLAGTACLIMVEAVVAPNISQTCLESASLIGPSLLNDTISSRVRGSLDQIFWNYKILRSLQNTEAEYELINKLYHLWTAMLDQFYSNHMSSYEDYWQAAKNNSVLDVIKGNQTALGMEVFWYKYANACNPPFCDLVVQNSLQYRSFLVIAQVGGISTLVLLFVRMLLWPALRFLFGWPLFFRPENAKQGNHQLQYLRKFSGKVEPSPAADPPPDTPVV